LVARRPSDEKSGVLPAARWFALKSGETGAELGRAVHGLLAEVEWADAATPGRLAKAWTDHGAAERQAMACVRAPALGEVWTHRAGAELWRERAFEMVMDGVWVTGVFDRVVIARDATGRPVGACVYALKTDEAPANAVGRHSRQLNLYRQAAAQLLGLSLAAVECKLVMTRAPQCILIPPA